MAWVAVNKDGVEFIYEEKPTRGKNDWALISLFNALGIAMNVDCERDMREMFLWYQKYQMSGKRLICKKMFGIITSNG